MKKTIPLFLLLFVAAVTVQAQQVAAPAPAPATNVDQGFELKDPTRGLVFHAPSANWSLNAGKSTVSLTNDTVYDAYVSLKKSWYTVSNVQDAYDKRAESLKRYLPGAEMLKEKESVKLGVLDALSMTYKDPAQQKVHREIVFVHKGVPYELTFTVKEENFTKVKNDFAAILKGIEAF